MLAVTRSMAVVGVDASGERLLRRASAVGKRCDNPLILDQRTDCGSPRFDLRGVGFNLDLFGDLTHLENGINDRTAVHLQKYSRLYECAESRQCCFEFIWSKRQVRQDVISSFIRDSSAH